jgi:hypothetical protein
VSEQQGPGGQLSGETNGLRENLMEASLVGGLAAYVERLRAIHRPTFRTATGGSGEVYSGCSCREVGCRVPYLLLHIERWRQAYEAKVEDFAAETSRSAHLHSVLADLLGHVEAEQGFHNAQDTLQAAREATRG